MSLSVTITLAVCTCLLLILRLKLDVALVRAFGEKVCEPMPVPAGWNRVRLGWLYTIGQKIACAWRMFVCVRLLSRIPRTIPQSIRLASYRVLLQMLTGPPKIHLRALVLITMLVLGLVWGWSFKNHIVSAMHSIIAALRGH